MRAIITSLNEKQTILIVDDSMLNRALLADMIGDAYRIIEAEDGKQAVAMLQKEGTGVSLVLLDYVMPQMNGFDVLEVMNKNGWIKDIPVIMVSAESDAAYVERAYELGVTDFINRPYDVNIVRRRVMNTLMLYQKQRTLMGMVADQVYEREKSNNLMVYILSHIVEFRNGESGMHVLNVQAMTEMILTQLVRLTDQYALTADDISLITMASSLHDIGKIAIPEEVLNKPGRFTDEEFAIMKTHSAVGSDMLDDLELYKDEKLVRVARDICRWHHERWDGRGYPDGLAGDEIPISAQVVALADVYDALTSQRVYKPPFSHDEALRMIRDGECGAFNPLILECLAAVADDLENRLNRGVTGREIAVDTLHLAEGALDNGAAEASSRTLELLDYERMKYHFFASMSNEVQFEFTEEPPMIVLSDWGDRKLGLPEIVMDPYNDEAFCSVFGHENLAELSRLLRSSDRENPLVDMEMEVTVNGETRWLHALARALWSDENPPTYLGSIGKFIDIDDRQAELRDLQFKAYHDPLTEVVNGAFARKVIVERLGDGDDCDRDTDRLVLAVCDLDFFKQANDTYGHQFGDKVLQHFAERLQESVRGGDVVARVGGDEFLICMECPVDPRPLIERIHGSLEGEFEGFPLSVSMGVATTDDGVRDYDELFRRADVALYYKKRGGRGGYAFYDDLSEAERGSVIEGATALSGIDRSDADQ
ncbi:diguanylate cyclase [Adlercreutzia sp. R21]|uniref:Diguanylate cyclase n=1 Tax=Adlercreutzia wanghongyangiae TaxID=3111451 RepID=A0ABU6IF77_9ACTN|nr:diguanylate cyclase [Adlercreutzia sp. R21]MEC4175076.1 diguanylate cyclase [Adlercreutzia sp. R7]MEC4184231.1 diguanylate cyclase [Adlercreutzia sp. R21]